MIKILNIIGTDYNLSNGGVVSFLKNYLQYFCNDSDFKYDILSFSKELIKVDQYMKKEIKGESVEYSFPKFCLKNIKVIKALFVKLLKENCYDTIHLHSANMGFIFLPLAKSNGVKNIVVHSHNTRLSESYFKSLRNRVLCNYNEKFLTHRVACSKDAGISMFKKRYFDIIPNAINSSKFEFSIEYRNEIRDKYAINKDDYLIGIVGRLCKQKNQVFLIKIMKDIISIDSNIKLMMVGDGKEKKKIQKLIHKFNLNNNVILVGHQNETYKYYSAFDLFVLPSIFEGFGIVLLEAISCGLPCICSDRVAFPSNIGKLKRLSLKRKLWTKCLIAHSTFGRCSNGVKNTIYDIEYGSKYFKEWYRK